MNQAIEALAGRFTVFRRKNIPLETTPIESIGYSALTKRVEKLLRERSFEMGGEINKGSFKEFVAIMAELTRKTSLTKNGEIPSFPFTDSSRVTFQPGENASVLFHYGENSTEVFSFDSGDTDPKTPACLILPPGIKASPATYYSAPKNSETNKISLTPNQAFILCNRVLNAYRAV